MYLYLLVRAVDHGNEHVEENDHHCDVIDAVQHVADVLYEFMVVLQHHGDHFRQPEDRPEEGLETLLHSARNERKRDDGENRKHLTHTALPIALSHTHTNT